jgi:hypothetical protein
MITVNRAPTGTPIYASKDSEFAREQSFVSFRFPVTNCRLFNYEYRLALLYWGWDAQTYQSQRADWDVAIKKRVHRQNRSVQAFLSWRFQQIAASFPATPLPKTLLLWAKLYSSPHIVNDLYLWDKSGNTFPLARWTPGLLTPAGMLPVQAWQSSGQYIWLPLEGPP